MMKKVKERPTRYWPAIAQANDWFIRTRSQLPPTHEIIAMNRLYLTPFRAMRMLTGMEIMRATMKWPEENQWKVETETE